jgi:hypothetical protein
MFGKETDDHADFSPDYEEEEKEEEKEPLDLQIITEDRQLFEEVLVDEGDQAGI